MLLTGRLFKVLHLRRVSTKICLSRDKYAAKLICRNEKKRGTLKPDPHSISKDHNKEGIK